GKEVNWTRDWDYNFVLIVFKGIHLFPGLSERLPKLNQVLAVHGLIVMFVYGWSLYWFLWNLSAWISFQSFGEIAIIFIYTVAVNLLESIVVIGILLLIGLVLPGKWFRNQFDFAAALIVIFVLSWFVYFVWYGMQARYLLYLPLFLLLMGGVWFLGIRVSNVKHLVRNFVDRTSIFSYIALLMGSISVLIVLFRILV
ncbi:MAG TPA: hypothetical protein VMT73_09565, partial [Anaerolineales bacterium]|nr:hypothetical protein [Anaerolineales bacterium]